MSVRRLATAMACGVGMFLAGCVSRTYEDLGQKLGRALENQEANYMRNSESVLADYRYWRNDPSHAESLEYHDAEEKEEYVKDGVKEVSRYARRAATTVIKQIIRGELGEVVANAFTPSSLDESSLVPLVDSDSSAQENQYVVSENSPRLRLKGKLFSPKIKMSTSEYEVGAEVFKFAKVAYGEEFDGSKSWFDAKARFMLSRNVYFGGQFKQTTHENGERERKTSVGFTLQDFFHYDMAYAFDDDAKHQLVLGLGKRF